LKISVRIDKVKGKKGCKKREKSRKIMGFDGFFEKWGGWFAIGSTSSLQVGFDWVCFSPRLQSRSFS
jgi:hypothetical protein